MKKIETMVISSVRPEPTTAGQIILYRLLVENNLITCESYGEEPKKINIKNIWRRIFGRLSKTRYYRIANDYFVWNQGRWLDPCLPSNVRKKKIVITMAHGDACYAALRYSKKHNLPLVTLFDDWYPDMLDAHTAFKKYHENLFRQLYFKSNVAFCVCPGMRDELGKHKASYILNRVPGEFNKKYNIKTKTNKFKVLYFGNLWDYGPMLEELIVAARNNKTIQFEVRGNNPNWNKEFKETMEKTNQWLPFAPREEYEKWMFTAEAFLIPMLFEEKYKRRMVTSFPSKIAECVQVEKPIIIWGPEYCSAIQWARQGSKALCVTSSDPKELIKEIERLINDKEEIERLTEKSRYAALNEFNRNKILCQFNNTLKELLERYESNEKSQQMLSISEKP